MNPELALGGRLVCCAPFCPLSASYYKLKFYNYRYVVQSTRKVERAVVLSE